jgi:hypothetical protein
VIDDESGVQALGLKVLPNQLIDESGGGSGEGAVDFLILAKLVEKVTSLVSVEGVGSRQIHSESFFKSLHHGNSLVWRSEVKFDNLVGMLNAFGVILELVASLDTHDHGGEEVFS